MGTIMKRTLVFTGSYSRPLTLGDGKVEPGRGKGISVFSMDSETGALKRLHDFPEVANPTYITVDSARKYLYCNHELKEYGGLKSAYCSAYALSEDGAIQEINSMISGGTDACQITVSPDGGFVLASNYASGSVVVYPKRADGGLGTPSCFLQHRGRSVNDFRQSGPHAHQVMFDRGGRHVLVPDLGADQVVVYDFDRENGYLIPAKAPNPKSDPGDGPRHCVFSPDGAFLYVIQEMGCKIHVYDYDPETAETKRLQTISTVPEDFTGDSACAAIRLHPSGRFIYGSNRGHDSVAIYRRGDDGLLTLVDIQPVEGELPRDICLTEDGNWLISSNQDSDTLTVFRVDSETGKLAFAYRQTGVDAVTNVLCVDFE